MVNTKENHDAVVDFLLKKSKEKDPEPQKHVDNVNEDEIKEFVKRIKDKIKVEKS